MNFCPCRTFYPKKKKKKLFDMKYLIEFFQNSIKILTHAIFCSCKDHNVVSLVSSHQLLSPY